MILCTGFHEESTETQRGAPGIVEVVLKPFTPEEMARAIRRAIAIKQDRARPGSGGTAAA